MKVEVDLTEYGVKAPKWYDPINPHVINASGGGSSNDVELTWSEYEALSEEEKMNGTNYFITDIGNPKNLVKKVLAFKERPFSYNTDYSFLLSESILNFDYISVELKNGNSLRSITTFPTKSYPEGNIEIYFTTGVSSTFNGRADFSISNGVNAIYTIYENNGNLLTQYTDILVTGYRYERVVVPNQMVNYSTVEQRIGTWIDGKPLYQITLLTTSDVSNINDNAWSNIPAANTPQNIKELVTASYRGLSYLTSEIFRFGYNSSSNMITVASYKSGTTLRSGSYITIQYTKTTD